MATHDYAFKGLNRTPSATLDEAYEKYFMDFEPLDQPLYYNDPEADVRSIVADILASVGRADVAAAEQDVERLLATRLRSPNRRQIIHGKTFKPIGTVGLGYVVSPYPEAFSLAEPLVANGARIMGGGCPNVGERAFLLLEGDGVYQLSPGYEIVNRYVLMSGHDGNTTIECRMTPYCKGTGTAFTIDASRPLRFKHTRTVNSRVKQASKVLRNVTENWNEFTRGVQKMIGYPISDKQGREFIDAVLSTTADEASTRLENIREQVYDIWKTTGVGTRLPQCQGTVFGVVQSFAEYADKFKTVRKSSVRDDVSAGLDARLLSAGAKQKQRAYAFGLYLANNKKIPGVSGK